MKITTCVPKQITDYDDKLKWLEATMKKTKTDIFITPQEFFGGDYMMPEKRYVTKEELLPKLLKLSKEIKTALIVGVVESDGPNNYQRLWFIDEEFKGQLTKFALPRYTQAGMGSYKLTPENNWDNRIQAFELKGIRVAGFFCWEIFSDILMAGLNYIEPDLVVSSIKFGIAGYPKLTKDKPKRIDKIQHCGGDEWYERLIMASKYELKAPIACSTNSWNEKARMRPLAGLIYPYEELIPREITNEDLEKDYIVTNEIDFNRVKGHRQHKFSFVKLVGDWPSWDMAKYTMLMKIHRMEHRRLKPIMKQTKLFKFNESEEIKRLIQINKPIINGDEK